MTHHPYIKSLLQKFVQGTCSREEAERVAAYCRENQLTEDFPSVDEVKFLLEETPELNDADADRIFAGVMQKAEEQQPAKTHWKRYVAIAASFVLFGTMGWYFMTNDNNPQMVKPALNGTEITLQLENGDIQVITESGEQVIMDSEGNIVANQQKNLIAYTDASAEELVYNTLTIPYAKRFEVQLSDGTHVHLNSGTTLKYPVKFLKGQERTVFLDGEAFFDVAKDAAHPFIVNADALDVRVLGTHFNVSAYPEDHATDVVLVEGSVGMYASGQDFDRNKSTILQPGDKGSFSKRSKAIATNQVTTQIYTAWIKGELVFRNMSFKNICRKLERHYNVAINIENSALASQNFNASFKDEPVEKVLGYFKELNGFNYTKVNNVITIK